MRRFVRVHNAPYAGFGAFAPMPSTTPGASSNGVIRTEGHPGTMVVPVRPASHDLPPPSFDTKTMPSNVAPDFFRPNLYVAHADFCAPPVPTRIDNVMPMPIPKVVRLPQSATHKQRLGGITATRWPRALIKWPTYGGGSAGS